MEDASSTNGFTQWFFLFLALFWVGTVGLVSLAGGWYRLASRFPAASSGSEGQNFPFVSMYIRSGSLPVGYRGCVFVTVSPAGARLSIWFPLRFLHPPLFIPWAAVATVQREELASMMFTAVHVRGLGMRLLFDESIGRHLLDAFNARYSTLTA